jgi:hypothetical protein
MLVLLASSGCVVLDDPDWINPGDDDDAADDDDSTDEVESCTDPDDPENWLNEPPDEWVVAAAFIDPDGAPVQELMITLCGGTCYNEPTDCDGIVYYTTAGTDVYVLEPLFAPNQEFDLWARSFDFVTYIEGEVLDLRANPYTIPLVEEVQPTGTGDQERIFASGLEVRFDADAIRLPFGPKVGSLGAVEIPPERFPTGGLMDWTPLRVWALAVWDLESEEPEGFQVVAPLTEAVPEGNEVTWLVAHYDYGVVEETFEVFPAELATDRMSISTPANQGIDRTTLWIAATRAP